MKKFRRKEKGIALIFTLMILALLLILALGFALNSMFEQKAAYNSASKSFSGFLAQTQMQKLLLLIKNDEVNLDNYALYSRDSGTPTVTDPNMSKDMLKERLPVVNVLDQSEVDTTKVNWNYVRSNDSSQRIIGRTAFMVISEGIPPVSIVDPKHDESSDTELRIGKDTSEMNIRHTLPLAASRLGGDALSGVFNWAEDKPILNDGFSSGKFIGFWESFSTIYSAIEEALTTTLLPAEKKEIRDNLSLVPDEDKEAFWADLSGDKKVIPDEFYKRFDLTRTDWDTSNNANDLDFIKTKLLLTDSAAPNLDMEPWTEADSDSTSKGLPWLTCFGFKDDGTGTNNWVPDESLKGTFTNVLARRQQIAANLKDYCDTDIRPTSDIDPKNWKTSEPKFTGNERTPYLNKIGIEVSATVTWDTNISDPSKYDEVALDVSVKPCAELIYIYNDPWSNGSLEVYVEGSVTLELTNGSQTSTETLDLKTTPSKNITTNTYTNGYSNLLTASDFTASAPSLVVYNRSSTSCSVKVTSFQITKVVVLSDNSAKDGYDYTKTLTSSKSLSFNVSKTDDKRSGWCGFACHDPRQNLNEDDWLELEPNYSATGTAPTNVFSITSAYVGMPNALNSSNGSGTDTESPSIGGTDVDIETTSDPVKISTTFIRNKPMESPWEIGFIHRGKRWQTINLKKYDSLKAFAPIDIGGKKYLAGGGLYADGDANILDQIKMTPKAKSPQKIKLLSSRQDNLEALFSQIRLGCIIDDTMTVSSIASGGSPTAPPVLTGDQEEYFAKKVMDKYKLTSNPETRRTRASVVDILSLPDASAPPAGITATTDAAQEELIGKIVNLTELSGKLSGFTVIILAQTIKDVGGTSTAPISITKYSNDGTSDSDARSCELGVFDAKINDPDDSNKNIYYDEITAEQKLLARCYRAVDGTIKVTSIKYVE